MNALESQVDTATCENLKLKGLNFDMDYKINYYTLCMDQAQRKIALLKEKQNKLMRDLEQSIGL